MKKRSLLVILLVLATLVLAACQAGGEPEAAPLGGAATQAPAGGGPTTGDPAAEGPAGTESPAYPAPVEIEQATEEDLLAAAQEGYPDITDGSEITWFKAYGLITTGHVQEVVLSSDNVVTLNLIDGRTLTSRVLDPQTLQNAIDNCAECDNLEVVTE